MKSLFVFFFGGGWVSLKLRTVYLAPLTSSTSGGLFAWHFWTPRPLEDRLPNKADLLDLLRTAYLTLLTSKTSGEQTTWHCWPPRPGNTDTIDLCRTVYPILLVSSTSRGPFTWHGWPHRPLKNRLPDTVDLARSLEDRLPDTAGLLDLRSTVYLTLLTSLISGGPFTWHCWPTRPQEDRLPDTADLLDLSRTICSQPQCLLPWPITSFLPSPRTASGTNIS